MWNMWQLFDKQLASAVVAYSCWAIKSITWGYSQQCLHPYLWHKQKVLLNVGRQHSLLPGPEHGSISEEPPHTSPALTVLPSISVVHADVDRNSWSTVQTSGALELNPQHIYIYPIQAQKVQNKFPCFIPTFYLHKAWLTFNSILCKMFCLHITNENWSISLYKGPAFFTSFDQNCRCNGYYLISGQCFKSFDSNLLFWPITTKSYNTILHCISFLNQHSTWRKTPLFPYKNYVLQFNP